MTAHVHVANCAWEVSESARSTGTPYLCNRDNAKSRLTLFAKSSSYFQQSLSVQGVNRSVSAGSDIQQ